MPWTSPRHTLPADDEWVVGAYDAPSHAAHAAVVVKRNGDIWTGQNGDVKTEPWAWIETVPERWIERFKVKANQD